MTIVLPAWLADLDFLVGAGFPEADEDALWRCAKVWETAAAEVRSTGSIGSDGAAQVLGALSGESRTAFESMWREIAGSEGFLDQIACACDELAVACDAAATEVEYAKVQYIGALVFLAASIALALSTIEFGGVSALTIPSAVAAAQFTIRLVLTRLISAVALSVVFNVSLDGLIQLSQILSDHRAAWDIDRTVRAIEDGAIYGAVIGGAFLGAGRFAPGLVSTRPRQWGVVGLAGGVGGVVAPLAHGEVPDGHDILLALSSSVAGGAPDMLRHPRPSAGLDALDPNELSLRGLGAELTRDRLDALSIARLDDVPVLSGRTTEGPYAVPAEAPPVASTERPSDWLGSAAARGPAVVAGPMVAHPDPQVPPSRMDGQPAVVGTRGGAAPGAHLTAPGATHPSPAHPMPAPGAAAAAPALASGHAPAPLPPATPGAANLAAADSSSAPLATAGPGTSAFLGQPVADAGLAAMDWRPRGGAPYPEWNYQDKHLDGQHNRLADALLSRAREAEARLTPIMRDVAVQAGGILRGEEHVLKGEASLKSKLTRYLTRKNPTLSGALLRLNDTVRYTVQLPFDDFASGAERALSALIGHDLRPVKQHPSWEPATGYLGLNTTWSDPVTNHVFEVQIHTEQTFHAKMVSHSLYDDLRDFKVESDLDRARQVALQAEHDAYFVDVPVPEGAADVGLPTARYDPRRDLPLDAVARMPEPDRRTAATDAEAVELVRETAAVTDAGVSFYAADDEIRDFAAAVPATDGYVTLDLHGSPGGFQIRDRLLTPDQLAQALRELAAAGGVDLSQGIKLISCDTAVGGPDSPAARLARELGVEVLAPDQPVWTAMDGTVLVASPRLVDGVIVPTLPPDGLWVRFDAGGVVQETYGGGTFGLVRETRPDRSGGAEPRAPTDRR